MNSGKSLSDLAEAVQLSTSFDVEKMVADLNRITVDHWKDPASLPGGPPDQDWRVLPLRSIGGSETETTPGRPGLVDYQNTPLASNTPYLAGILAQLPTEVRSARLVRLGPGGFLGEHRDRCGFDYGMLRLHIPITTDRQAVLKIDGQEHRWQPGTFWYGDFSRMHAVRHDGTDVRVHLIVDVLITPELLELFPADFVEDLPMEEVIFAGDRTALSVADHKDMQCDFAMPKSFVEFTRGLPPAEADGDRSGELSASIRLVDSDLVLHLDGQPAFGLTSLGDGRYRLMAGMGDRLLHIDTGGEPAAVTLQLRHGTAIRDVVCTAERPAS